MEHFHFRLLEFCFIPFTPILLLECFSHALHSYLHQSMLCWKNCNTMHHLTHRTRLQTARLLSIVSFVVVFLPTLSASPAATATCLKRLPRMLSPENRMSAKSWYIVQYSLLTLDSGFIVQSCNYIRDCYIAEIIRSHSTQMLHP